MSCTLVVIHREHMLKKDCVLGYLSQTPLRNDGARQRCLTLWSVKPGKTGKTQHGFLGVGGWGGNVLFLLKLHVAI